jgi:hypothetical protein
MTEIRTDYLIVLKNIETGFTRVRNIQLLLDQVEDLQAKYEAKKPEGKYLIVRFERAIETI